MGMTVEDIVKAARAQVEEIDVARARELQAGGAVFIDVREPAECAKGAIPGALQLPRGVLEWKVGAEPALADREQPVVVYCQAGGRAALAAVALAQMGFTNVMSIAGGYGAWDAED